MVQKWPNTLKMPHFGHFLVLCKGYVHPQRNVTRPTSQKGHKVKIFNLVRNGDATSLHTSAQMVQKWPTKTPKLRRL